MITMNFLKQAAYRMAVFLCILFIGSASLSLGNQPAVTMHSKGAEIIGPSATGSEKNESLTPAQASRTTLPNLNRKVSVSWYGPKHHNKRTASGQRFNMYKNTLAHRTLPFGTKVRLVNPDNGKSAVGIVNDRGPYVKGRDLDISYALAKQLGFTKKGVVELYLAKR
jgi:rare lipoprotein A (peptidoglycan hydrolase)